jgi:hypothetical protein
MKISLRILFQEEAKRPLLETGEFSNDELQSVVLDLDSQSERFRCFLRATRNAPGNWFNPVMQFTKKELDSATYYQLDCRKTLPESPRDYEWNDSHVESLDLIKTDAGMEIQLPDRLAVSKVVLLKSNMVAGLGEWLQEFLVHADVAAAFSAEGFSGFSLRPVFNSKTKMLHPDVHQLYSNTIMPPAELGRNAPPADDGSVRQLGCLVYENLEQYNLVDFNRTAEDWAALNMPLWVVSARVREFFIHNKFKGWAFRPVLAKGSEMHREYEQLWDDLFEQVATNPKNHF